MSLCLAIPALISASLFSFSAGLLIFKIKSRWCSACGSTLSCPACMSAGAQRKPSVPR